MSERALDALVGVVTERSRLVVVVMLLVTAGVAVGATDLNTDPARSNQGALNDTTVAQKDHYIDTHYGGDRGASGEAGRETGARSSFNESELRRLRTTARQTVYVREPGGNALSKVSLVETLRFQQRLRERRPAVETLDGRGGVDGIATLVSARVAGDRNASLGARIAAMENATTAVVESAVASVLAENPQAEEYLPTTVESGSGATDGNGSAAVDGNGSAAVDGNGSAAADRSGSAAADNGGPVTAESRRLVVTHAVALDTPTAEAHQRLARATAQVHGAADRVDGAAYFTLGRYAETTTSQSEYIGNTFGLVVPFALVVILAMLAFAYRDLADIGVSFLGVLVSLAWMFGILGWLDVPATESIIVGPVLVVGLSVDYGLHVFMRDREQRDPEGLVRASMGRALRAVAVAFALVTLTTSVGFLANLTNEFAIIRDLAVGITLGVVSALVVFVTFVPALKVTVDETLAARGVARDRSPLGSGRFLRPVLSTSVRAATAAAPVVLVVALVAGAAGGVAWGDLERQGMEEPPENVADWKTDLPGPMGWDEPADIEHAQYVAEAYRSSRASRTVRSQILVQGPVTDPETLDRVQAVHRSLANESGVATAGGRAAVQSPLSVLWAVSGENRSVARALERADTDDDRVPDENLTAVYDALSAAAPAEAGRVLERRPDGSYASLRLLVGVEGRLSDNEQADLTSGAADRLEGQTDLRATAVGAGTWARAESIQTARSILETLVLALVAVAAVLTLVYRRLHGSASLGAVTAVPIALVTALLVGAMSVLAIPLTIATALLMSLVVGLGIDYSIHVSDRFARELDAGDGPVAALDRAVRGTGGALLGSTLTSAGAFVTLRLHPDPRMQNFGTLVVLALALSFVVSVFVLPSALLLWHRHVRGRTARAAAQLRSAVGAD